jgi:hypothetical protein
VPGREHERAATLRAEVVRRRAVTVNGHRNPRGRRGSRPKALGPGCLRAPARSLDPPPELVRGA